MLKTALERLLSAWLVLPGVMVALAGAAAADVGVGVNHSAIVVDERLAPGVAYELPAIGVINTGSQTADYAVQITYLEGQRQSRPPQRWFQIEPQSFRLAPGQTQQVGLRLTLPAAAAAGEYFALLEAQAVGQGSDATIGVAAAARLSFSVKPASWLEGQRARIERFLDENQPWSQLLPLAALSALGLAAFRRRFRLTFKLERR